MEGQAEVYSTNASTGKLLNGTLLYQLHDTRTAKTFAPLWDDSTSDWKVLDDVKVWFNEESGHSPVRAHFAPSLSSRRRLGASRASTVRCFPASLV